MTRQSLFRRPAYTALLLLQVLWLSGCSSPPIEEAIEQAIRDMAKGIEERKTSPVMDRLHDDMKIDGHHGSMNRDDARRMLMAVFLRHQKISVILTNIQVTPDSVRLDRASARFNALVTGGSGGLLPQRAELYRMRSEWQLDGSDWKLIEMDARRALE